MIYRDQQQLFRHESVRSNHRRQRSEMVVMSRVWVRWLPAVVVPVVIIAGALAAEASTPPSLPTKTAPQVLALVTGSSVSTLSGTVQENSDLGLPQLPSTDGSSASASSGESSGTDPSQYLSLLTGTNTARIYLDGRENARVQLMNTLAETDLVRHGSDVWLYTSKDNTASHATLPAGEKPKASPGLIETPQQAAQHFLSAVDKTTDVTLGDNTSVAGQPAYDLVLTPQATDTLVESVSIAVDAKTGLPLSVSVQARGQKAPAFQVAFSDISYQTPEASLFAFTPPAGATVKQLALPQHSAGRVKPQSGSAEHTPGLMHAPDTAGKPSVIGSGWDAIAEVPASAIPASVTGSPLLKELTTTVTDGRVLHTSLVNVLLTNDGRAFIGSVSVGQLQAAAADQ
jgi:outer membrane lipoprotein-sorting protein